VKNIPKSTYSFFDRVRGYVPIIIIFGLSAFVIIFGCSGCGIELTEEDRIELVEHMNELDYRIPFGMGILAGVPIGLGISIFLKDD